MLGQDTVQMGGFTVNAQPFGLRPIFTPHSCLLKPLRFTIGICNIVSSELQHTPVSGLLGLAFQRIAFSTVKPFWQILAERGDWSEPVMTFHLNRFVPSLKAAHSI